ncbi:MAG: cobalamin biosynthesis protein [Desulfovibrio sp.]|nr:cobalamin biosynthesis protein [Desulfovibrio sp.]
MTQPDDKKTAAPLACYVLSRAALPLAMRLSSRIAATPWTCPSGRRVSFARLYVPARFYPRSEGVNARTSKDVEMLPFESLRDVLVQTYRTQTFQNPEHPPYAAHVFASAAGIAVRALAPLLRHKSLDPPVVVLSPDGRFAVSLVSGHWGGGNDLTRHIGRLVGSCPVITTASDACHPAGLPALDMLLRDAGLRILDWETLPKVQAALLEGLDLPVWDPCRALPEVPGTRQLKTDTPHDGDTFPDDLSLDIPLIAAHWRSLPRRADLLRCAVPRLYAGVGCRKDVPREAVFDALEACFATVGLETRALAALATVTEKRRDSAIVYAAWRLGIPLLNFSAGRLAACASPNPSPAAGRRFGQAPFSVCEAAALTAAGQRGMLVLPKRKLATCLTLAVAVKGFL